MFQGMVNGLGDLPRLFDAQSRAITAENPTGAPGCGGMCELADGVAAEAAKDLGKGWKVNPYVYVQPGESFTLAEIEGPGVTNHIWITLGGKARSTIIRFYWDDQQTPSVECPLGDFFASGWGPYAKLTSLAVCVNPSKAFNCYWQMPFRKRCRITLENRSDAVEYYYYQVDYTLCDVPQDAGYFHAQFRRVNPVPYMKPYVILDGVQGRGVYVGTYLAWGVHNNGWWGEGEVKFYLDEDTEYPTICGTGTEDYFCGSHNFENPVTRDSYEAYCTPYAGLSQVIEPDRLYSSQMRFGMYRWHIPDPIRFKSSLKVTVQALGWRSGKRYMPLQDDVASVAFWYQELPTAPFPPLGSRDDLEVV